MVETKVTVILSTVEILKVRALDADKKDPATAVMGCTVTEVHMTKDTVQM